MGSYVLALGTVKVVEARLEENSLGDDLMVESLHDLDEAFAVGSVHEGSRLCFFYGGRWVSSVRENVVQIVAEIRVTDETDFSGVGVLSQELLSLNLIKSDVKSTNASSELTEKFGISFVDQLTAASPQ